MWLTWLLFSQCCTTCLVIVKLSVDVRKCGNRYVTLHTHMHKHTHICTQKCAHMMTCKYTHTHTHALTHMCWNRRRYTGVVLAIFVFYVANTDERWEHWQNKHVDDVTTFSHPWQDTLSVLIDYRCKFYCCAVNIYCVGGSTKVFCRCWWWEWVTNDATL